MFILGELSKQNWDNMGMVIFLCSGYKERFSAVLCWKYDLANSIANYRFKIICTPNIACNVIALMKLSKWLLFYVCDDWC